MFFFLSKTLDLVLEPLWWSVALFLAGAFFLARANRRVKTGLTLSLTAVLVLLVCASRPVAHHLMALAEEGAVSTWRPDATYDVIILLGGTVDHGGTAPRPDSRPLASATERPQYSGAVERLLVTWELLRSGRAKYVIASGGVAFAGGPSEARVLTDQLAAWGIEPERLIAEEQALNTRQNATRVATIMKERGFTSAVLVTSAFHLPRAAGSFRAADVPFDALPVDFHMRDPSRWSDWLPRTENLLATSQMLREFSGRWVYRVMGYVK